MTTIYWFVLNLFYASMIKDLMFWVTWDSFLKYMPLMCLFWASVKLNIFKAGDETLTLSVLAAKRSDFECLGHQLSIRQWPVSRSVSTQHDYPGISTLGGVQILDRCLGKMLMLIYLFCIIVSSFCSLCSCQVLAGIPVYICLQIVHCSWK